MHCDCRGRVYQVWMDWADRTHNLLCNKTRLRCFNPGYLIMRERKRGIVIIRLSGGVHVYC